MNTNVINGIKSTHSGVLIIPVSLPIMYEIKIIIATQNKMSQKVIFLLFNRKMWSFYFYVVLVHNHNCIFIVWLFFLYLMVLKHFVESQQLDKETIFEIFDTAD